MEIYSRHGGNLLVAEHGASEASVRAALKDFDRRLVLSWEHDDTHQTQVWNVHLVHSQDLPALFICSWRENGVGRPLPLTHSLVDEVKRLREVDTMKQVDDANARLKARLEKQDRDNALAIAGDHKPYVDRHRVTVTTSDAKNRKPAWQRNRHLRSA